MRIGRRFLRWNRRHAGKRRLLMTAAIVVPLLSTTSAGIAIAPVSDTIDALAVLAARSPGLRAEGARSTKALRMLPLADADMLTGTEAFNNLPPAAEPPMAPLPAAVALPADVGPAGEAMLPPAAFAQVPYVVAPSAVGAAPGGSGGSGGGAIPTTVFPGQGGGGGGGGGGIIVVPAPAPTPVPPITPVPEPGMWLLLLTAFPLVGAALRRRTRSSVAA